MINYSFFFLLLICFSFSSIAKAQIVTYGAHTKDTSYQKQIVDSLSLSTEFYLLCTPKSPIYKYDFKYSMNGRNSQEVGNDTKPQFLATTNSQHSVEIKQNTSSSYESLLTSSSLTLKGSQITTIGTLKDSGFTVQGYNKKFGTFSLDNKGIISKFNDNFESVMSDPGVVRIRSLFIEDIDRKFIRYLIPKYTPEFLEVGDVWEVNVKDTLRTLMSPLVYFDLFTYKVTSFTEDNQQKKVTLEFRSDSSRITQNNFTGTDMQTNMESFQYVSGVYEIDKASGMPIKIYITIRTEITSKNWKDIVTESKRVNQTLEYTLL